MSESPGVRGCRWGGVSIELGDRKRSVQSLQDLAERFRQLKLPMNPALLGYECFHESTLPSEESMGRVIAGTLAATSVDPLDIDLLIVASSGAELLSDRQLLPRLLKRRGLFNALPLAITSQECTGMLSAINLAHGYVLHGACNNVLVVSCDRAQDDSQRIHPFGIVSDAASACLVSSSARVDYLCRGYSHLADLQGMQGGDDFSTRKQLIDRCTSEIVARSGVGLGEVRKVFSTNFFTPIAKYNAAVTGLADQQLYMASAADVGHCLCADPLVNLAAYIESGQRWRAGDAFLLQAYAPGLLASMLVEVDPPPSLRGEREAVADTVEQAW